MANHVMRREVCLKHRKNRREISCGCELKRELAAVFVLFCRKRRGCAQIAARAAHSRSSFKSRMPECQSGDAGASPAERTIFFNTAGASLRSRVSKTPRARGGTETLCHFQTAGSPRGKAAAS